MTYYDFTVRHETGSLSFDVLGSDAVFACARAIEVEMQLNQPDWELPQYVDTPVKGELLKKALRAHEHEIVRLNAAGRLVKTTGRTTLRVALNLLSPAKTYFVNWGDF